MRTETWQDTLAGPFVRILKIAFRPLIKVLLGPLTSVTNAQVASYLLLHLSSLLPFQT